MLDIVLSITWYIHTNIYYTVHTRKHTCTQIHPCTHIPSPASSDLLSIGPGLAESSPTWNLFHVSYPTNFFHCFIQRTSTRYLQGWWDTVSHGTYTGVPERVSTTLACMTWHSALKIIQQVISIKWWVYTFLADTRSVQCMYMTIYLWLHNYTINE